MEQAPCSTDDDTITILWTFIRNDLPVVDFESWLYARSSIDEVLGEALAFDLMATDYRDRDSVYTIKQRLAQSLRPGLSCECLTLSDLAAVPMGGDGQDGRVFASLDPLAVHSGALWWLHAYRCKTCGQAWLTAQEERIYDEYLFRRMTQDEARHLADHNRWPGDFLTYEAVLKTCATLGPTWQWDDPLAASLRYTVQDLITTRPDITPEEIAACMGIEVDHAMLLLGRADRP